MAAPFRRYSDCLYIMKRFVVYLLALSLAGMPSTFGQARGYLTLRILEGDGAFNDIKHKQVTRAVVEVRDDANNLVSGAEVTFTLPLLGAGGTFAGGKNTSVVATNSQGTATAADFTPNSVEGRFIIRVTATYQGKQGTAMIAQTNTLASVDAKSGRRKKYWIIAIIGAAAGVGIALAIHSKTAPTPTVLSSGGITVGGPL